MISLALLGLFQALFLPGLVVCLWFGRNHSFTLFDKFIISTPLSLIINYGIVTLLTWSSLYTQNFMLLLSIIEIGAFLIYVYLHASGVTTQVKLENTPEVTPESHLQKRNRQILQAIALLQLLWSYAPVFGTAIWYSDAAASWNRWAQDWFDQVPKGSWGYPPALPILYSIVYKFANTTDIQIIAKLVAGYFPFYGLFCIWRVGHAIRDLKWTALIAGIFYGFLLTRGYAENDNFVFQGFADPVIASLAAYCLLAMAYCYKFFTQENRDDGADWVSLGLLCVGLASPALVKQNGLVLCVVALATINMGYFKHFGRFSINGLLGSFCISIIAVNWYVFSYVYYHDFTRAVELLDPDIAKRIWKAVELTIYVSRPWISILFVVGILLNPKARTHFAIFVLPLWLFWAILVSYDYRTAYMVIPSIAFIAAAGMELLSRKWMKFEARSYATKNTAIDFLLHSKANNLVISFGILLFLVLLPFVYTDKAFLKDARERRISANDMGNNRFLNDLLEKTSEKQKVITCVDGLWSLPGSKNSLVVSYPCEAAKNQWLKDDSIKYLYWKAPPGEPFKPDFHHADAVIDGSAAQHKQTRLKADYSLFEKCPCTD
jgi:hypothetical protein